MRKEEVRTREMPPDLAEKVRAALEAVRDQKRRFIKCPHCMHNTIAVFEDTRGHVQTKCPRCGRECIVDTVSMHRSVGHKIELKY